MKTFTKKPLPAFIALSLASLYGCGGGADTPDPQDVPKVIETTSADISGTVVKGTISNAVISVEQMNGSAISIDGGEVRTNTNGKADFSVTGGEGFGVSSMFKITATADSDTAMICDAANCANMTIGESLSGAPLTGSVFTTMSYVDVPYANDADGTSDATFQANALTTLATALVEQDIADERNVSVRELFELALSDNSDVVLKALGSNLKANVFNTPLVSAEAYENFVTGEQCSEATDEQASTCTDVLVSTDVIKLSLLNAAFANIAADEDFTTLPDAIVTAIAAARDGDETQLATVRERLLASISAMPLVAEFGLTAEDIIDVTLAFKEAAPSSGPVQEVTTAANIASATITARNRISDGESEAKAFDNDPTTKWLDHNDWEGTPTVEDPSWIQIQFAEAHAVNSLFITSANDAESRDPQNFNLVASNDGENWVTLAEFIGESFDERLQRKEFRFINGIEYSYYRLNITKNRGEDSLMQLSEIELVGPIHPSVDHTDPVGSIDVTGRARISDGEAETMAFDNNLETKWLDNGGVPSDEEPAWVEVVFPEAVAVDTLAITSANDAPERDPQNFNLQGSNDGGETWFLLGEWIGESFDERFERQTFTANNSLAYSKYRLNITKNKGDVTLMQLSEIELIGPVTPDENHAMSAGASITARNAISEGESGIKAFDGDPETKWLDHNDWAGAPTSENPAWAQVAFTQPVTVNKLALTSANDAESRDPQNFNVQASNDGTNWVTLSSWLGEDFDDRFQRRVFAFSNDLGFSYYRFNVTKNRGDDTLMQIAEIELIGPTYSSIDLTSQSGTTATASSGDAPQSTVDNDVNTNWSAAVENGAWIQFDMPASQVVNNVTLSIGSDTASAPADFNLVGSNDGGSTWQTIASWTGETWDSSYERSLFDMANGFAYSSYRLNITATSGSSTVVLSEVELIGPDQ
jgi:hypothetical protein